MCVQLLMLFWWLLLAHRLLYQKGIYSCIVFVCLLNVVHLIEHNFSDWLFCGNSLGMPAEVSIHWGWVIHTCVSNLTIIGPDNVLSPGQCQAIIWTNVGILLIEPWGTNFSEISIEILTFSFKKMHLKVLFAKRQPSHPAINVLRQGWPV